MSTVQQQQRCTDISSVITETSVLSQERKLEASFKYTQKVHSIDRNTKHNSLPSSFTDFSGTGFQLAVESRVTSSNSVPDRFFRMPHMYWSISRPSRSADLLKPQPSQKLQCTVYSINTVMFMWH